MISIIICSRNSAQLEQVKKNIAETVGVPFEILSVDNSTNKYSISTAYNTAASAAKFDWLCFMHEDVIIKTNNWGDVLVEAFKSGFGLIGVAGSKYKSRFISGWTTGNPAYDFYNVYHGSGNNTSHYYSGNFETAFVQCVVLDGVWLGCEKSIWERIRFNDQLLHGFHFYDIDFSIRCSGITKVAVTNSVVLEHLSSGKFDNTWVDAALIFHKTYKKHLPVSNTVLEAVETEKAERIVYQFWRKRLKNEPISFFKRLRILWYAYKYMPTFVLEKLSKS